MPSATTTRYPATPAGITTVGIDVGGERKGFHAVALTNGHYASHISRKGAQEIAQWCSETVKARVIAVDAPCRWSEDGHSRPAESELKKKGIGCFSTPTRETAVERKRQHALGKATDHYGWMLCGEELFRALVDEFPICRTLPTVGRKCCIETFPHAITWHLRGDNADASQKRKQRRELLARAGIDLTELTNIDLVDAALCALTAYYVTIGEECLSFGNPSTGLIIVPAHSIL